MADTNTTPNTTPNTPATTPVTPAVEPAVGGGIATFVKVPGKFRDIELSAKTKIGEAFEKLGIDVTQCEIQKNGAPANLDDFVQPGDTVMAVTRIRGNYEVVAEIRFV